MRDDQFRLYIDKRKWKEYSENIDTWQEEEKYRDKPFFVEFCNHL